MTGPRAYALEEAATPKAPQINYFDRIDLAALLLLTVIAFVIRFFSPILPDFFVRPLQGPVITDCVQHTPIDPAGDPGALCGLAYPYNKDTSASTQACPTNNGQVFDEVYFPVFACRDLKGIQQCHPTDRSCTYNYYDPEPPLAKELIAVGELSYGWYRAHFQDQSGDYIDLGFNTFGWRIAACLFGVLCIPMMYLFARRLWPNRLFAIAAATLVCFDGMFFIQSRIGMIDIFPIFFILLAYFVFLVHIQSRTFNASIASLVALGVVLGIGIASKWIVLAAWASIVFFLVMRAALRSLDFDFGWPGRSLLRWRRPAGAAIPGNVFWPSYLSIAVLSLIVIPIAIYLLSWYPFFARGQFHNLGDLWSYQVWSYTYHHTLTATHPYGSRPWSWPLLSRPVLYYADYSNLGMDRFTGQILISRISNLGNPWIWWTSLPCMAALPYFIVRYRSFPALLILLGFITQYLPWWPITRVLFMYHMFGGLIFMILALAFVLVQLAERLQPTAREAVIAFHLATAVLFFAYFYPVWTGLPISVSAYAENPGTPPWGPKLWLMLICDRPESDQQLFCWN